MTVLTVLREVAQMNVKVTRRALARTNLRLVELQFRVATDTRHLLMSAQQRKVVVRKFENRFQLLPSVCRVAV